MIHQNLVGIDVSDASIKVLKVNSLGDILSCGQNTLPVGIVEDGEIRNHTEFGRILAETLRSTKPQPILEEDAFHRVALSLPESKLYTHQVEVPHEVKSAEESEFITKDAAQLIPFDLTKLYWDYHISARSGVRYATFVGAPKEMVENHLRAFTHPGMRATFLGGSLTALGMALLPDRMGADGYAILDMGATATTIGIYHTDAVAAFSVTVPVGGRTVTERIVENLKVSKEEAERLKMTSGLTENTGAPPELRAVIGETYEGIIEELLRACAFVKGTFGVSVRNVILSGGAALLPGLVAYMEEETGRHTELADPFLKMRNPELLGVDTHPVFFAHVIGLSLRESRWSDVKLNLLARIHDAENVPQHSRIASLKAYVFALLGESAELLRVLFRGEMRQVKEKMGKVPYRELIRTFKLREILTVIVFLASLTLLGWVLLTRL